MPYSENKLYFCDPCFKKRRVREGLEEESTESLKLKFDESDKLSSDSRPHSEEEYDSAEESEVLRAATESENHSPIDDEEESKE